MGSNLIVPGGGGGGDMTATEIANLLSGAPTANDFMIDLNVNKTSYGSQLTHLCGFAFYGLVGADSDVTEEKVIAAADAFSNPSHVYYPLVKAGRFVLHLDEGWCDADRDGSGNQQGVTDNFPSGITYLSDYLHDRGFKFGLYTQTELFQNSGGAGSLGFEEQDMAKWIEWHVDFAKIDGNNAATVTNGGNPPEHLTSLAKCLRILRGANYPIITNCSESSFVPQVFRTMNSWRANAYVDGLDGTNAIGDFTDLAKLNRGADVYFQFPLTKPEHVHDFGGGFLQINSGYRRAAMMFNALFHSIPIGLANLTQAAVTTVSANMLANREFLDICWDPLCEHPNLASSASSLYVYWGRLANGDRVVGLQNRSGSNADITVNFNQIDLASTTACHVRNVINQTSTFARGSYTLNVLANDCALLRLTPQMGDSMRVQCSSALSPADNTATKIPFNVVLYDNTLCYDAVTNFRPTVTKTGKYRVSCSWTFADPLVLLSELRFIVNGSVNHLSTQCRSDSGSVSDILSLVAGDYLEVFILQDNAANAAKPLYVGTASGNTYRPHLTLTYIGA